MLHDSTLVALTLSISKELSRERPWSCFILISILFISGRIVLKKSNFLFSDMERTIMLSNLRIDHNQDWLFSVFTKEKKLYGKKMSNFKTVLEGVLKTNFFHTNVSTSVPLHYLLNEV